MIHQIANSLFNSNTWIIELEDTLWLVDCGDVETVIPLLKNKSLSGILLTHAHFDHIYGLNTLFRICSNALLYTNVYGKIALTDSKKNLSFYHETPYVFDFPERVRIIDDGDTIELNEDYQAVAVATPGHNNSCLSYVLDDCLFTGDSYIPGLKVVTSLPGGNKVNANESLEKIMNLAKGRIIYPGHGASQEKTM